MAVRCPVHEFDHYKEEMDGNVFFRITRVAVVVVFCKVGTVVFEPGVGHFHRDLVQLV